MKRIKAILSRRRGESLAGVLAAFVVMLILLGLFATSVQMANRLNARATQQTQRAMAFLEAYYKDGLNSSQEDGALTLKRNEETISLPDTIVKAYSGADYDYTMYAMEETS